MRCGFNKRGVMAVIDVILLFVGLSALIMGTRLCVNQAILIARHYRLSDVFIGWLSWRLAATCPLDLFPDLRFANPGYGLKN